MPTSKSVIFFCFVKDSVETSLPVVVMILPGKSFNGHMNQLQTLAIHQMSSTTLDQVRKNLFCPGVICTTCVETVLRALYLCIHSLFNIAVIFTNSLAGRLESYKLDVNATVISPESISTMEQFPMVSMRLCCHTLKKILIAKVLRCRNLFLGPTFSLLCCLFCQIETVEMQRCIDHTMGWLKSENRHPFVVVGPDGCGKSMLLHHCFDKLRTTQVKYYFGIVEYV